MRDEKEDRCQINYDNDGECNRARCIFHEESGKCYSKHMDKDDDDKGMMQCNMQCRAYMEDCTSRGRGRRLQDEEGRQQRGQRQRGENGRPMGDEDEEEE